MSHEVLSAVRARRDSGERSSGELRPIPEDGAEEPKTRKWKDKRDNLQNAPNSSPVEIRTYYDKYQALVIKKERHKKEKKEKKEREKEEREEKKEDKRRKSEDKAKDEKDRKKRHESSSDSEKDDKRKVASPGKEHRRDKERSRDKEKDRRRDDSGDRDRERDRDRDRDRDKQGSRDGRERERSSKEIVKDRDKVRDRDRDKDRDRERDKDKDKDRRERRKGLDKEESSIGREDRALSDPKALSTRAFIMESEVRKDRHKKSKAERDVFSEGEVVDKQNARTHASRHSPFMASESRRK